MLMGVLVGIAVFVAGVLVVLLRRLRPRDRRAGTWHADDGSLVLPDDPRAAYRYLD